MLCTILNHTKHNFMFTQHSAQSQISIPAAATGGWGRGFSHMKLFVRKNWDNVKKKKKIIATVLDTKQKIHEVLLKAPNMGQAFGSVAKSPFATHASHKGVPGWSLDSFASNFPSC